MPELTFHACKFASMKTGAALHQPLHGAEAIRSGKRCTDVKPHLTHLSISNVGFFFYQT